MTSLDVVIWIGLGGFVLALLVIAKRYLRPPVRAKTGPLAEAQEKMDKESWRWTDNSGIWPH